ncbi:PAS domain S-box protein [Halobaculum sp. WSA2]|uniref:histidine kinase n=1 Tax=Halobaculum saliterrae TaxID=2073113 RepID=A0A6B0SWI0_9EURY|nr:PAS domain S-box protein [Halobaculum saliterrae]MXR43025.1 PAS domain S-box protein [Halobaculum saliterrae]
MSQWSVTILGVVLLLLTLARAAADTDDPLIDFIEVVLPFVVGIGLILGGIWLARTTPTPRVRQLSKWTLGGGIVGVAVNLWFVFIISLEQAPSGEPVVLNLNGAGIFMTAGVLLGYYATGLQAREHQLELSENRFRALTENSSFAVISIDETSTIRYANDATEALFGYPTTDLVGEPLTKLMPTRFREAHLKGLSRYLSEGARTVDCDGLELAGLRADGEEFPVEISFGEYVVDDDHLFTGVIQDISDRKAAEQQLRDHTSKVTQLHEVATEITKAASKEQVYQRTADGTVDVFPADVARVAIADGDQFVPAASSDHDLHNQCQPVSATLGYAGQSYQSGAVLRLDDLTDTRSAAQSPLQDGGPQPEANPAEPRSLLSIPLGEYGVVQAFAHEPAAFSERDEQVAEMLATHVTTALQRIEAESTIRRERDRLEEFASILSHDLRNPLNVAQGRLELIQMTGELDHVDAIDRALDRMERLIEDMLTLAREGDAVGETEPVALRTVATQAWNNVATNDAALEVEATVQIDADHSRFIQVFENLYRNAIEHGGDTVTVRVGAFDGGFYIEDTGPGIPEDEREDIFESGYTTNQDGTGFGLAIVKRIVEAHGWEIDVTAGRDGGARFEISGI